MMTIQTNCSDRKELVRRLSVFLSVEPVYLRTPTYAYSVGSNTVNRDSSISGERDDLMPIVQWLMKNGYIDGCPAELTDIDTAAAYSGASAENMEMTCDTPSEPLLPDTLPLPNAELYSEAVPQSQTTLQSQTTPPAVLIDHTIITLELKDMTPTAMTNLIRILYTRQSLINSMLQKTAIRIDDFIIEELDNLRPDRISEIIASWRVAAGNDYISGIALTENRLTLPLDFDPAVPDRGMYVGMLLAAIVSIAKASTRAKAERMEANDKYHANAWLNRLGFGGTEHKALRHALMAHLPGYAAFKSDDKMQAHRDKLAEQRRIRREMNTGTDVR